MQLDLETMNVPQLRRECARQGLGSGGWRACAGKSDLLAALRGETVPQAPTAPAGGELGAMLAGAIEPFLAGRTISREEFDEVAAQAETIAALTARVEKLETEGGAGGASLRVTFDAPAGFVGKVDGLAHRQLPQVVAWVAAGVPLWLWGGAGAGKTHLARQVAKALGLPVYVQPIDPTITVGKLLGFRSMAEGTFIPGVLFRPYVEGGVVMLDEVDTGDAGILAALNSLLANGHYTFPDGVEYARHPNFRVIAGANTNGVTPNPGYRARQALDAATLDRFALIRLDLDPGLEMAVVCGGINESTPWQKGAPLTGAGAIDACKRWVSYVQKVRAQIGASVLISPRASMLGAAAIRQGIPAAEVADALLFKLVTEDTRKNIVARCGAPE